MSYQQGWGGQGPGPGPGQAPGQPSWPGHAYQGGGAPEMAPHDQRTWAMVAHLSHIAGSLVGLPFLGPLVVYLIVKDRGPFVRRQAAEALNFQLLLLAVYLAALVLTVVTLGVGIIVTGPLAALVALAGLVLTIIAAVQSFGGIDYRYPLSWRLVR